MTADEATALLPAVSTDENGTTVETGTNTEYNEAEVQRQFYEHLKQEYEPQSTTKKSLPSWLPWAIGGGLVLILGGAILLNSNKKKRK